MAAAPPTLPASTVPLLEPRERASGESVSGVFGSSSLAEGVAAAAAVAARGTARLPIVLPWGAGESLATGLATRACKYAATNSPWGDAPDCNGNTGHAERGLLWRRAGGTGRGGETKEEDNILHALTTYLFSVPGFVNTLRPEIGKRRKGRREQGNEPESVSTDTQV